jgi:hypothetical protein
MKKFIVNIDMKWSHDLKISGKTKIEARKKAVAKFIKNLKPKDFNINVDEC